MAENEEGFVFKDNRKVDPETGEVRSHAAEGAEESAPVFYFTIGWGRTICRS